MYEIILLSHGPLASAMRESLAYFFPESKQLRAVEIDQDGIEKFRSQLAEVINEIGNQELLIFTDLLYGTPFNEAAKLVATNTQPFEILAGVNLPMLIEAINFQQQKKSLKEILPDVIKAGEIKSFSEQIKTVQNAEDE